MKIPQPWRRGQNGSWYVTLDGKQHNLGRDEVKAKEKYAELLAAGRQGNGPEENCRRLLDLYFHWCKRNHAETTCIRNKRHLRSFGKAIKADLTTRQLKPFHILKWLEKFPDASDTYVNTMVTVVQGCFAWAKSTGYIAVNPLEGMKKPAATVRQEYVPSDQWEKLVEACQHRTAVDLVTFMLLSGARPFEVKKIEARHVEGDRIVFSIEESKGKKASRMIYLADDVQPLIARLCEANPVGPIFLNKLGRPWNKDAIKCLFTRLKARMGVLKLCATTLRHSFCHHRLTSGQDSLVVSKLMGHVDGRMVATRYGHIEQNSAYMRSEANRIENPLSAQQKPEQPDSDNPQRRST